MERLYDLHPLCSQHRGHCHPDRNCSQSNPRRPVKKVPRLSSASLSSPSLTLSAIHHLSALPFFVLAGVLCSISDSFVFPISSGRVRAEMHFFPYRFCPDLSSVLSEMIHFQLEIHLGVPWPILHIISHIEGPLFSTKAHPPNLPRYIHAPSMPLTLAKYDCLIFLSL